MSKHDDVTIEPKENSMRRLCWIVALILSTTLTSSAQAPTPSIRLSADIERRIDSILSQMTLEEKIDLLGGVDGFFIRDIPRLNLPRLKMADGPLGVRNFGPATSFAAAVGLAATWNPTLAELVGIELGRDARAKGVHFLLAPGVNIYRAPMNGRNFEYFGEDPFLASRMAVSYIKGVQSQGVSATIKHYLGNNSEFDRHNTDSIIDERTLREIYLPTFEAAVKEANVGAVMSSYNLTNGLHMSQNKYLLTDVLKKEWGFDGLIMSDWSGTYDGIEATNAYKEGLFVGYRGYEHNRTKPLFPFGFGLSYTSFTYSNLSIKPTSSIESGPRYEVSFEVKNAGTREGADVAQIYVGDTHTKVPRPAKELKGFSKVILRPGETGKVSVILDSRALSYYDVNAKQWRAEPGDYNVLVGRSSEQIELRGKLTLPTPAGGTGK
jgi:hypothetical protein